MDNVRKSKSKSGYIKKPKLYKVKLTELYKKVKEGENIDNLLKNKDSK